ncbi:hypothetical protein C4J98_3856 [Pseudomonas orientalis]|nr:hypothetical protein C4J98_3856 [Pseudomonas orientalis]
MNGTDGYKCVYIIIANSNPMWEGACPRLQWVSHKYTY